MLGREAEVLQVAPEAELLLLGGHRIPLPTYDTELLVGCQDASGGVTPEIDLTPFGGSTSGVSRRHATISLRNGQWTIRDENSTNGTFVNGAALTTEQALQDGDVVSFGGLEMRFHQR